MRSVTAWICLTWQSDTFAYAEGYDEALRVIGACAVESWCRFQPKALD